MQLFSVDKTITRELHIVVSVTGAEHALNLQRDMPAVLREYAFRMERPAFDPSPDRMGLAANESMVHNGITLSIQHRVVTPLFGLRKIELYGGWERYVVILFGRLFTLRVRNAHR